MKQIKKMILCMLCVGVICGMTACGSTKDENMDNTTNDATDNTDRKDDGVLEDMGEDVKDGVEDMGEDVKEGAENLKNDVKTDANQDGIPDDTATKDGTTPIQ